MRHLNRHAAPLTRLAVTLALLTLLPGCALLADLISSAFKQPTLDFKRLDLREASFTSIGVDTVWQVGNPNSVGLKVAEVDYTLLVEDKAIATGKPPKGFAIPANGSGELVFPATVLFADVLPTVQQLTHQDTAKYRIEGHVGLDTPVGLISLPFSKTGTFEVPKLPKVQFANPKVTGLSFTGAQVVFPLTLTNQNNFPLPITNLTGTLMVEGVAVATVSTGNLGTLTAKGTQQVSIPATVSFISAGQAVVNAINGGKARVRFDAQVHSGKDALPIAVDQALQFLR